MSRRRSANRKPAPPEARSNPPGPRRYRWGFRLGILVAAGLGVLAWYLAHRPKNGLTIENRTEQTITSLEVTADGETTKFTDVPPGATRFAPFGNEKDNRFVIAGEMPGTRVWNPTGLTVNTWSLVAHGLTPGAGPAAYFLGAAENAIAARPRNTKIRCLGIIGDRRTVVILPGGDIQVQKDDK
jgi:hypothetical protein